MWTYNYNYSNELYHHGVKGMKWGIRRNRNKVSTTGKKRSKKDLTGPGEVKNAKQKMKDARHTSGYKDAKNAYKMVKKNYNECVKEYAKEIRSGETFVRRAFERVTGIDRALAKAHLYQKTAKYTTQYPVAKKIEEVKNTSTYRNGKVVVEEVMKTNGRRSSTYARVTIKEDDGSSSTWFMNDVEGAKKMARGR